MEVFFVPSVVFLVFVAPIWIITHYRYKSKSARGLVDNDVTDLDDMLETIDRLVDRIETLEEILTEEHPQWRKSVYKRRD